jgi:hypothetical protein
MPRKTRSQILKANSRAYMRGAYHGETERIAEKAIARKRLTNRAKDYRKADNAA